MDVVIDLNRETLFHDLTDERARREVGSWLRFSGRSAAETGDGFSPAALGFPGWLLVRDSDEGRRAQVEYADYWYRNKYHGGPDSPHRAVVGVQEVVTDADGTNNGILTDYDFSTKAYRSDPDWSPDGQRVAYQERVNGRFQLQSIKVTGGTPKLLAEGDEPVVAPRTGRVAFVKDRRIWLAPIDGSKAAEPAFFAKGASISPSWSPDGSRIAFSRRGQILVVRVDRTRVRRITPGTDPAWSPNGGRSHSLAAHDKAF